MRISFRTLLFLGALALATPAARGQTSYIFTDLGTLGGSRSDAHAINNRGQVVGDSDTATPGMPHPFLYTNGQMQDIGTLGGNSSIAYGINDHGQG